MMRAVSADKAPPERFSQLWNGLALTGGTCANALPPRAFATPGHFILSRNVLASHADTGTLCLLYKFVCFK